MATFNVNPRGNISALPKRKSVRDFQREEEEFQIRKERAAREAESQLYLRDRLAFEQKKHQDRMDQGGFRSDKRQAADRMDELYRRSQDESLLPEEREDALREYNLLGQIYKTYAFDRGTEYGAQGIQQIDNYVKTTGGIKATQEGMAKQAEKEAELRVKREAERPKRMASLISAVDSGSNLMGTIATAREQASKFTTGAFGAATSMIPQTPAYDLKQTVNTIKANIGFDKLQRMRDESPTGGALGQVSEMENRLLQSSIAAVEQAQSKGQFLRNLDIVERQYKRSIENLKRAYKADYGTLEGFPFEVYGEGLSAMGGSLANKYGLEE
jgi:hypothetical protein